MSNFYFQVIFFHTFFKINVYIKKHFVHNYSTIMTVDDCHADPGKNNDETDNGNDTTIIMW